MFYKNPYGYYRIRLDYRFVGEQANQGPGWATRNSGIMILDKEVKFIIPCEREFNKKGFDLMYCSTTEEIVFM